MNFEDNDKMDQMIRDAIGREKVELDFEEWKAAHRAEIEHFNSESAIGSDRHAKGFRMIKFAVAACLIIAAGVSLQLMQPKPQGPVSSASSVPMMSRVALRRAYTRGGIEAVEEQYNKAYAKLGPRAGGVSMNSLLNQ